MHLLLFPSQPLKGLVLAFLLIRWYMLMSKQPASSCRVQIAPWPLSMHSRHTPLLQALPCACGMQQLLRRWYRCGATWACSPCCLAVLQIVLATTT